MRNAIKTLQGLCQGRNTALENIEIESSHERIKISDIEESVTYAFQGNLTKAIGALNQRDSRLNKEKVLDILLKLLIESEFSEEHKITICLAMSKIDPNNCSKFQVYGILALIARETNNSTIS